MNDFYRHKKSDKIKWIITSIAFVLVFVLIAGLCMQLFGTGKVKPSEWFVKQCEHVYDEDGKCEKCGADKPAVVVDVQINVYDKDEDKNLLETTSVLTPDEETNTVEFTYSKQTLAVPTVADLTADKYEITYFKLNKDTNEYDEITEEMFLEGHAGTYHFILKFKVDGYEQVKDNPLTLVIKPMQVNIVLPKT